MKVESVLTFAAEGILKKLTSLAAQEISLAWGFKAELNRLCKTLSTIEGYLADVAHQPQGRGKSVDDWVKNVKGLAEDAEDVLDEFKYELLRRKVEIQNHMKKKVLNFFSLSNPVAFGLEIAHKIEKINASLVDLKSEASVIKLVSKEIDAAPQGIREDRETNAFIGKDEIVIGRKELVPDIVTTLTNFNMNQENLSVMAIVGMPGLGKTTLAKSVYNEGAINEYFNKKLWVCVSNTFNVNSILTAMLELLSGNVRTSQQALLTNLREELSGKRYFLVLDDVWNEESEKWESLMSCLSKLNSAPGSKIIVTTRSGIVASLTETLPRPKLELLSTDECWLILKHAACSDGSSDISLDLERIGREIAKTCEGLPLMAKVLGGILHSKNSISEWSSIKESKIWNLHGADRIMSVLQLSFDNLESPALKQCFAYCSMFMKDARMKRDDLIQLWMAQGLLHSSREQSKEMEDIGNEYFDILFQSSLFQDATVDDDGIVTECKMHDLVHDLAERVSESGSMMRDFHEIQDVATPIIERIPKVSSGKLRSLFSNAEALPGNMLPWFKALRVLNLYLANIEELPSSIGKLKHLKYLNISETGIKRLPNSIGKLYNLQTLRATKCGLVEFPEDVQNLINLRHVYCDKGTKFPVGVLGKLTSLRTLPSFYVDKEMGRGIEELAALNQLKGEQIIYNLEHVSNGDEVRKAKLEEKKNVRHLEFVWSEDRSITNNNDEDVLEGLQPHSHLNLETLVIRHFMGAKFPSWMMCKSSRFDNLKRITFEGCNKCEKVPTLGHLPHLTLVWIDGMDNLKYVGEEVNGNGAFPALKEVHISNCKELIEWMDAPKQVMVFPWLEKLEIKNCPKLRKVPSHSPCLRKLFVYKCPSLQSIPDLHNFTSLCELRIFNCERLESLVSSGPVFVVELLNCSDLQSIPTLNLFTSLRELRIENCNRLESLVSSGPVSIVELLSIGYCGGLQSIPALNLFTSLHELRIVYCERLDSLVSSEPVSGVELLTIEHCGGLLSIPALNLFTSLRELRIENCERLGNLVSSGPVSVVELLTIEHCGGLQYIPDLHNFTSLHELRIKNCERIESLVSSGPVSVVELLTIGHCGGLQSIPDLHSFTSLSELRLENCERLDSLVSSGPVSVVELLTIEHCGGLQSIPALNLFTSLRELRIVNCERLESFVSNGPVSVVELLTIEDCGGLQSIPALNLFTSLRVLMIKNCERLESLMNSGPVSVVELLIIENCSGLQSIPDLHSFTWLRVLSIQRCERLDSLVCPQLPASLVLLEIRAVPNLENLPSLENLTFLSKLVIVYCGKLKYLPPGLHCCASLKELTLGRFWGELDSFPDFHLGTGTGSSQLQTLVLDGWPKLKSLPHQIQDLTSLTELSINHFNGVEALEDWLGNLTSLTRLDIWDCKKLKYLPSVRAMQCLTKLQTLRIWTCPLLQQRCTEESGPEWPKISHIPDIEIYD